MAEEKSNALLDQLNAGGAEEQEPAARIAELEAQLKKAEADFHSRMTEADRQYRALRDDRDEWRKLTLEAEARAEAAISILADMHDDEGCKFKGAQRGDVDCLACIAQAACRRRGVARGGDYARTSKRYLRLWGLQTRHPDNGPCNLNGLGHNIPNYKCERFHMDKSKPLDQILYEAYCEEAGWKSAVTGAPLPQWDQCSEAVKRCWWAAAEAEVVQAEWQGPIEPESEKQNRPEFKRTYKYMFCAECAKPSDELISWPITVLNGDRYFYPICRECWIKRLTPEQRKVYMV